MGDIFRRGTKQLIYSAEEGQGLPKSNFRRLGAEL